MSFRTLVEKRKKAELIQYTNREGLVRATLTEIQNLLLEYDFAIEARVLKIKQCKKNVRVHGKKTVQEWPYHRLLLLKNIQDGKLFYMLTNTPSESRKLFTMSEVRVNSITMVIFPVLLMKYGNSNIVNNITILFLG